jgi:ABC-type multidrug transport system ATPase subunit
VSFDSAPRPRIGFVSQQDVLPPTLTVYEALLFAAELRIPENVSQVEKKARVEDVIEKLGLSGVRNVRIGDGEKRGISGGEMRRVSIGLELVARPDVLLLDEPTSGLDSVSAAKVTKVLHALAHDVQNPTVVIASVHQPRYGPTLLVSVQRLVLTRASA